MRRPTIYEALAPSASARSPLMAADQIARCTIVLARIEMTGIRKTGRFVERDRNTFPEYEAAPEAKACCWKNRGTASDEAKARTFAEREGYTVFTFPTNERDPLGKAKRMIAETVAP